MLRENFNISDIESEETIILLDNVHDVDQKHIQKNVHTKKNDMYINSAPSELHDKNTNNNKIIIEDLAWDALLNNKLLIVSILLLIGGYYLQDTVFTKSIAKVTSDIPGFVKDIDAKKVLIVLLPYIIALVIFYVYNIISTKAISKIELETISKLTEKLIESIKTSKKQISINELMIHIKNIYDTKQIYTVAVTYIIPTFLVGASLMYNFIESDGPSSLVVILLIVVMMLVTTKLEFDSVNNACAAEEASIDMFNEIHEVMTNIDSVITSNTKDVELNNVDIYGKKTHDMVWLSELNNSNVTYGLQAVSIIVMLGINYLSYKLYVQKRINTQVFTANVLLSLLFMDYYNYCIFAIGNLIACTGRYYKTQQYFYDFTIDTSAEKDRIVELKITNGDITFKNITFKYENKLIFDKLNLNIKGGTIIGLLGPIGSGKSSLMKMMAGIINYNGIITIDNQNLNQCTYATTVDNIAYIPQHPKLFNKSVYYNINYGSSYTKEQIITQLDALGLIPFINSLADKLDTIVGKEGNKLSGGQRQFVSLIRAIIQNKKIFLLDEPTSSLDTTNKQLFMDLIKRMKNKTVIISTHDKQIMCLFDRVININNVK